MSKRPRSGADLPEPDDERIDSLRLVGLDGAEDRRSLQELERGLVWASGLRKEQLLMLLGLSPPLAQFAARLVEVPVRAAACVLDLLRGALVRDLLAGSGSDGAG